MPLELKRGTNFSHWLSQTDLTNREALETRIARADFERMAGWGADHIRLPVDYELIESPEAGHELLADGLKYLDRAAQWARETKLRLVIDLHKTPGMSFHTPDQNDIWDRDDLQARFAGIWSGLARHYNSRTFDHLAFELLNEPTAEDNADWNPIARAGLEAIRAVSRSRTVLIGSNKWCMPSTFPDMEDFKDPNVIYTCHFYEPFIFTHQRASWCEWIAQLDMVVEYPTTLPDLTAAARKITTESGREQARLYSGARLGPERMEEYLRPAVAFCRKAGAPLYCGEFGVFMVAPVDSQLRWYRDVRELFRRHGVGWSNWDYRGGFALITPEGEERPIRQVLFPSP